MEYVVLSEFSKSTEIWKENPEGVFNFVNLTYLEVYKCKSLKYIFTVSMALDLLQLKEIKVRNCPMMEQIITREGAEEASIVLPRLQSITLRSCSNLRSFSLGSITMECPSLLCIDAVNCSKLLALASTFVGEKDTETVAAFFNDKVSLCMVSSHLKRFSFRSLTCLFCLLIIGKFKFHYKNQSKVFDAIRIMYVGCVSKFGDCATILN